MPIVITCIISLKARNIHNRPVVNRDDQTNQLQAMQAEIQSLRDELIRAQYSGAVVTVDSSLNTEVCVWGGGVQWSSRHYEPGGGGGCTCRLVAYCSFLHLNYFLVHVAQSELFQMAYCIFRVVFDKKA